MNEKNEELGYPVFLYIFGEDGMHDGKTSINSKEDLGQAFKGVIPDAIKAGREVMVTDDMDFCVFHAKERKILHPSKEYIESVAKERLD